jgi:hypothetical protein
MGAAHFPLLKPQQADAQSVSAVQTPVMNWVPWRATRGEAVTRRETATVVSNVHTQGRHDVLRFKRAAILKSGAMTINLKKRIESLRL